MHTIHFNTLAVFGKFKSPATANLLFNTLMIEILFFALPYFW